MSMDRLYVALDQMNREEVQKLLHDSHGKIKNVKIGLEAFLKYGREFVFLIHERFKTNIFLDLKLHDIPVTVAKAIQSLEGLPIAFLTIHLTGGKEMIIEALKARDQYLPHTKILGVSFLTSLDQQNLKEMFNIELNDQAFVRLFTLASSTKIDGVVCSPHEAALVKKLNPQIITMTPGVRFQFEVDENKNIGDQKRVASVEWALTNNSDFVVMGRSLTKTNGPEELNSRLEIIAKI